MDRGLVSREPQALRDLAQTPGASVGEVEALVEERGTRSRRATVCRERESNPHGLATGGF